MPKVAVSIINYRTGEMTLACIASVLSDFAHGWRGAPVEGEIVVVDNASGDGSAERISDWMAAHPDAPVRLIRSPVNAGFSGGHNQGFAASASDHVLVLNSDAELRPGCLGALLDAAEAEPRAGLIGPTLEGADGTRQTSFFRCPTALSEIGRGASSGPVAKALKRWDVVLGPDPDPARIEWTAFACVLLRRAMIDAIGPMDEGYFLYFEDVEYCRRARRAGWTIRHVPEARALHHVGGSTGVTAANARERRRPAYYYAARTRHFYQQGGTAGVLAANAGWILGRGLAALRPLVGKRMPRAAEAEFRDIWINATRPLGPRHAPADAGEAKPA